MTKPFYAFIDASNLFYGGVKSLGWRIDYKKLIKYIKSSYNVKRVFYYGGIDLHGFPYDPLGDDLIDLDDLLFYLNKEKSKKRLRKNYYLLVVSDMNKVGFYKKLKEFGYELILKPVKIFKEEDGSIKKKANCDVDMTLDLMKYYEEYEGALVLTGDGDFITVLKYLRNNKKIIRILARGERTAKEIKRFAGGDFRDFNYLREILKFEDKKKGTHIVSP